MNNVNNPSVSSYPGITTQTDVTASRVLGTVYQNTLTIPLFCSISVTIVAITGACTAFCDANAAPSLAVARVTNSSAANADSAELSFWVLPGYYYKISGAGTTFQPWIECS